MLADAYAQSDHHEAARQLIERLLEENRGDPVFLADLGQRAQWQQRWDLALSIYEAVLRQAPHNLKALKCSGQIYAWTNQPQQAIQALETYNRLYPKDYETQYLLGELYMAAHREADAEKQYRKAMKLINAGRMKSNATGATSPGEQAQP
jgi:predicted Zn-dependent protease